MCFFLSFFLTILIFFTVYPTYFNYGGGGGGSGDWDQGLKMAST